MEYLCEEREGSKMSAVLQHRMQETQQGDRLTWLNLRGRSSPSNLISPATMMMIPFEMEGCGERETQRGVRRRRHHDIASRDTGMNP